VFNIKCDMCGYLIELDFDRTVESYCGDMDYLIQEDGQLAENTIQNYMIYKCSNCGEIYRFTLKDLELRIRKQAAISAMNMRRDEVFKNIKPNSINPDNGFEYCGKCDGYDGEGNCFIDVIKQCSIRKFNEL